MSLQLNDWLSKVLLAVIPIILAAFTTIAWQNSHAINAFALKLDVYQKEVEHHRMLIEKKMGCKD
jgi:hypothetical protein